MKKKIKKKTKRKMIIGAVVAIILLILIVLSIPEKTKENHEEYNSLKELLERFECVYIKEKNSDLENVKKDIYLKFGKDLYTDGKSNERYFVDIIQSVAKFKMYENFRMIDEEKQIEIIAIANENKTVLIKIYINGDSNYFGNKTSEEALQKQEEQHNINMQIKSEELKHLIEKDWKRADVDFGTRETIYEDYYYYFDEGMEIRTIATKVYNIVFRANYKSEIVEGITTNMTQENVIKTLGNPTFGAPGDEVIGYKGSKIYLFFTEEGISVYPIENYDTEEFINIVKDIPEDMGVNEFLDSITNKWNDYDKYEYSLSNYICLRYSLKGIQIQFNLENNNGIVFYNNYTGDFGDGLTKEELQKDSSKIPDRFYFENQDLVYIAELERYDEEKLIYSPEGYKSLKEQAVEEFYYTVEKKSFVQKNLRVISKNRKYANANVELDTEIISILWIDDENLVYSVKNKGIYIYNAKKYKKQLILETTKECNIKKYENGILYYNDTNIKIIK